MSRRPADNKHWRAKTAPSDAPRAIGSLLCTTLLLAHNSQSIWVDLELQRASKENSSQEKTKLPQFRIDSVAPFLALACRRLRRLYALWARCAGCGQLGNMSATMRCLYLSLSLVSGRRPIVAALSLLCSCLAVVVVAVAVVVVRGVWRVALLSLSCLFIAAVGVPIHSGVC